MNARTMAVYIMASQRNGTLYVGVTGELPRRVSEHRSNATDGFTNRYSAHLLAYFEIFDDPVAAISREKQLKKWNRAWKIDLIEKLNPEWNDLFDSIQHSKRRTGSPRARG